MTDFDLLQLPNLISRKIWVSQSEFLTLSNVELSPKIKIQDLQNSQNYSLIPPLPTNYHFDFFCNFNFLSNWWIFRVKLFSKDFSRVAKAQCGNYGNSLSRILGKIYVKVIIILNKLLKSWFDEIFFWEREFLVFPHGEMFFAKVKCSMGYEISVNLTRWH